MKLGKETLFADVKNFPFLKIFTFQAGYKQGTVSVADLYVSERNNVNIPSIYTQL